MEFYKIKNGKIHATPVTQSRYLCGQEWFVDDKKLNDYTVENMVRNKGIECLCKRCFAPTSRVNNKFQRTKSFLPDALFEI